MSSSAEGGDGPACRKCFARPAGRAWFFAIGMAVVTLGFVPYDPGPLCEECRDRYNFVGVLLIAVVLVVAFVLVVVLAG